MAAASHCEQEAMLTRKPNGIGDVCNAFATDRHTWVAVDHRIPDRAGVIITRLPRQTNASP
jgi:hypothetical protein